MDNLGSILISEFLNMCALAHIGAPLKGWWRLEKFLCAFIKQQKRPLLRKIQKKAIENRKKSAKFDI